MSLLSLADDRAWCRAVLPRVSRTFALNIRLLRGDMGEAVRTGYLLCRAADALEDSWPGAPEEIQGRFDLLRQAMEGDADAAGRLARAAAPIAAGRADLALVAELPRVWRVWAALVPERRGPLAACVQAMAGGMSRYASRAAGRPPGSPYLDTEEELHDYCYVVAGCVGVMLTQLFEHDSPAGDPARAARRLALAPVVGEALQLTNILLDWPSDVRRGRCYVPAAWLDESGLVPADLVGPPRPEVDAVAARLERLARQALARVPDYLALVPPTRLRYRLFTLWAARWALASLEHARRDPAFPRGNRPRLPRGRLWREAAAAVFASGGGALRRASAVSPAAR